MSAADQVLRTVSDRRSQAEPPARPPEVERSWRTGATAINLWPRHWAGRVVRGASAHLYAGDRVYCPCCERGLRKFVLSEGSTNKICPACGSLERQRLRIVYLTEHTDVLSRPTRLLHFAPEQCLHDRFRRAKSIDYVTADLDDLLPMVDIQLDITSMEL